MNRILYFFPYTLTNAGTLMFFMTGCFLLKDSYWNPGLITTTHLFAKLSFCLLILSIPKYLIKGIIPGPFEKGPFLGFWHIGKYLFCGSCAFFIITRYKAPLDLSLWYQCFLILSFMLSIYSHFFWGRNFNKKNSARNKT